MPLVDLNSAAVWDSLYQYAPGIHYTRAALAIPNVIAMHDVEAAFIAASIGLTATSSLVIVGGGFGWRAEALLRLIPTLAIDIIDTSTYIQGLKTSDAVLTINNDDITKAADRNRVLRRLSRTATHVLTEDVLANLSDAEAVQFDGMCRAFNVPLAHLVTTTREDCPQDPRLNWHTGPQWRALLPHQPSDGNPQWILSCDIRLWEHNYPAGVF